MLTVPFQVRLQFSEKQTLPGSNVKLSIEAAANSQCALRAVDQSVLLLRPERELSPDSVRAPIYFFHSTHPISNGQTRLERNHLVIREPS